MPRTRQPKTITVEGEEYFTIYPTQYDLTYLGIPAREMTVSRDEWLRLNEYQPPAFVCDPLPPPDAAQDKED